LERSASRPDSIPSSGNAVDAAIAGLARRALVGVSGWGRVLQRPGGSPRPRASFAPAQFNRDEEHRHEGEEKNYGTYI
jgi:hypothetical protein